MGKQIFRRDFLKGLVSLPFLGYFGLAFKNNIDKATKEKAIDYQQQLKIDQLEATKQKLLPPTGNINNRIRFGIIGNGYRSPQLLGSLGYIHPEIEKKRHLVNGKYTKWFQDNVIDQEDLNIEFVGICDTFEVHAQRGVEISTNYLRKSAGAKTQKKLAKIYPTYREMLASNEIDAVIIATPDHSHAQIAIDAAKAGKHVYLEKPMAHSIEEAIALREAIKSSGIVFQLGHENRQQMSFKIGNELYKNGVLGTVSMVQTYTNRNNLHGAWIRERQFDKLGNMNNINWKEFLCNAPWHEFDPKRYFNWQRYSDYGTSVTGNDFSHTFDCVNQVLGLGIPKSVVALGGQYYYKNHGDMPDVLNAVFNYPEKSLTMTYDCSLKNGIYRQTHILGSEAAMDIDRAIYLYKDSYSQRYKEIKIDPESPLFYYAPNADVDAVTSATEKNFMKGGYGATFIDGKVIDATFLHLKEWVDAIRGQGKISCGVEEGVEETVTFCLANLSYENNKIVRWDKINEKVIIG